MRVTCCPLGSFPRWERGWSEQTRPRLLARGHSPRHTHLKAGTSGMFSTPAAPSQGHFPQRPAARPSHTSSSVNVCGQLLGWSILVSAEHTVGAQEWFSKEHTLSWVNTRTLPCWEGRSELGHPRWTGKSRQLERPWRPPVLSTPPAAAEHVRIRTSGRGLTGGHRCGSHLAREGLQQSGRRQWRSGSPAWCQHRSFALPGRPWARGRGLPWAGAAGALSQSSPGLKAGSPPSWRTQALRKLCCRSSFGKIVQFYSIKASVRVSTSPMLPSLCPASFPWHLLPAKPVAVEVELGDGILPHTPILGRVLPLVKCISVVPFLAISKD